MSPLVVSQLLPPLPYFDVVIFDEASQITPADAVTSILRGRQLVVAGDDKQLPPTAFFASGSTDDDSEEPEPGTPAALLAGTSGFESILDALGSVLGFRQLTWHYRSRDERLIAFSNAHIYDRTLVTFPGADGSSVLTYVPAPSRPGADTNSPAPEVDAVVDLILRHARERPAESLGVITMGIKHRDRIEERLRDRLRQDPGSPRNSPGSSTSAGKSGSSSRTSNASRAMSATRSSCRSATARTTAASRHTLKKLGVGAGPARVLAPPRRIRFRLEGRIGRDAG
jgi:hypothetical protein